MTHVKISTITFNVHAFPDSKKMHFHIILAMLITSFGLFSVPPQTLIDDPLYIGLKHDRVRGEKYDALVDEFMKAVVKR